MHVLRNAQLLTRLVLVWFALSIGAAIASPVIKPVPMELVCSSSGAMKLLVKTDDGVKEVRSHTLDCPLCAGTGPLPPAVQTTAEPASPLAHVLRPIPAAHIAWLTAAPLPARGPPLL
ncbi:DUF2946 family protein [Variovorax terrae]|uniref:DUF2946 domain-containing protein n=1 Tax=Variovorax terrae TaxID=2923278 RepID=A0A9X1VZ34_9BURK|nr:DUF2946 family protein [Variovorax terrae]MCJ0764672.1 DUF2946 domain-containing protein [Variovorax terrae]